MVAASGSTPAPHRTDSAPGLDRRTLLTVVGGVASARALGGSPADARVAAGGLLPVSMAMHIHGSFSEGAASMDAHLEQARRTGCDVVWWTDHDFRQAAFGYRTFISFDEDVESERGWDLTWVSQTSGDAQDCADTRVTMTSPEGGGKALQLSATSGGSPQWCSYQVEATAKNFTYSTSYCDTTVTLDYLVQQGGANAGLYVEIGSSYRPPTGGRPAGRYRIQYRIDTEPGYSTEEQGLLGVVGLPGVDIGAGWKRVTLDLRSDHAELWPDTVADDASLWRLRIGVRARLGAEAGAIVDRLRFDRGRQNVADGVRLLRNVVATYAQRYPDIRQYAAAEVSLVLHLNAFGGDHTLPTYSQPWAIQDESVQAQEDMVDFLHSHGSTVCINHPLGSASSPEALAERLITRQGLGADVIELANSASLKTMERVFDIVSRNAVFLTANGTTDDHDGDDWLDPTDHRWLTSVWSVSKEANDLCRALRAGRAWFYDPLHWRGELSISVNRRAAMGGVVFVSERQFGCSVRATQLPAGCTLEFIVGDCDRPGVGDLTPSITRLVLTPGQLRGDRYTTRLRRGAGVYVRAVVRSSAGTIIGFSNPAWVLPEKLRSQIAVPPLRRREALPAAG